MPDAFVECDALGRLEGGERSWDEVAHPVAGEETAEVEGRSGKVVGYQPLGQCRDDRHRPACRRRR